MKHSSPKPNGIWLFCASAGIVFLNFPFIQVFNTRESIFGVPVLVIYIFLAWSLLLSGLMIFSRILYPKSDRDEKGQERRENH